MMTMELTAEVISRNPYGFRESLASCEQASHHYTSSHFTPSRSSYDNGLFSFVWVGYSAFAGVASIPEPLVWRMRSAHEELLYKSTCHIKKIQVVLARHEHAYDA